MKDFDLVDNFTGELICAVRFFDGLAKVCLPTLGTVMVGNVSSEPVTGDEIYASFKEAENV